MQRAIIHKKEFIQLKYSPIIVIESERDNAALGWLERNLKNLKNKWGYQTICLDQPEDFSFDEFEKLLNAAAEEHKIQHEMIEMYLRLYSSHPDLIDNNFISSLSTADNSHFVTGYVGMLKVIKNEGLTCKFIDSKEVKQIYPGDVEKMASIKKDRLSLMARHISDAAKKTNGRVITLIGSGNYTISEFIKKEGINPDNCIFLDLFNPSQIWEYFLPQSQDFIKSLRISKIKRQQEFPKRFYLYHEISDSTDITKLDKSIETSIQRHIQSRSFQEIDHKIVSNLIASSSLIQQESPAKPPETNKRNENNKSIHKP